MHNPAQSATTPETLRRDADATPSDGRNANPPQGDGRNANPPQGDGRNAVAPCALQEFTPGTRSLRTVSSGADIWQRIANWHKAGYTIVIATDRPTQVKKALEMLELPSPPSPLSHGVGGVLPPQGEPRASLPSPPSPLSHGVGGVLPPQGEPRASLPSPPSPLSHGVGEGESPRGAGMSTRLAESSTHSAESSTHSAESSTHSAESSMHAAESSTCAAASSPSPTLWERGSGGEGLPAPHSHGREGLPAPHSHGREGLPAPHSHGQSGGEGLPAPHSHGQSGGEGVIIHHGNLGGGFVWDAQKFVLITDAELFENRRLRLPPRRFNEGVPITSIMDLQPGDYVVHIYHGVGVFRGLTTLEREGVKREYLLIEYAHPDRIFVPVDQLDRIQKYIAPDDKPPEIKRLSSTAWARTVAKARQKAKEVAEELVRIYALREKATRPPYGEDTPWQAEMEAMFPYIETEGQLRAIQEVKADLESPHPMDRLLIGDVGFGKTEVAIRAAFKAILAERQVALLCPTTILAYQHYQTFRERFEPFGAQVALLSRLISPAEQKRILHGLKTGAIDMVIGTHRLLSDDVQFKNLGLVIIDEEQRFGVMQKERFKKLRGTVDVLSMSATPIPRTLYMALTEIRDMSMITDPPPGRLPIRTVVAPYTDWMAREAILRELQRSGQVFYVVPRIQGITHVAERLQKLVPHARIAVAHGQMPAREMEDIILAFYNHEYDVLVSTTIIENGLDMPNVNTLIVEGAERFGMGQLYQLRGRVGRSDRQAYAYFLFKAGRLGEKAEERLQALKEFSHLGSGFALALRDLEIRGAGNLLGEEQHGAMRSVGLELYQAMLRDAIRRLRKGETSWDLEAPVQEDLPDASKLPVDAFIPHDYIADVAQRLGYYKRIAGSRTREELKSLVRELRDRYGELPAPVRHLIRLMEQRILAHALGVQSIGVDGKHLVLKFKPDRKLKARWQLALQKAIPGTRTQPDEITTPLGDHPLETLMTVLAELKSIVDAG